jgi:hypothetical protein
MVSKRRLAAFRSACRQQGDVCLLSVRTSCHRCAPTLCPTRDIRAGQIVGRFYDGRTHGFIATPIPPAPPVINVTATPATLWPPNGKLLPVTITWTITDEDSAVDEITATYEVTDEYGLIQRNGAITVDEADGSYAFTIQLRASGTAPTQTDGSTPLPLAHTMPKATRG